MAKTLRLLLATATLATVALVGAGGAFACGNSDGYSYGGPGAAPPAYGISAIITPLGPFDLLGGHVAGWVGVGGPRQGPNGTSEWIQAGYTGFPSLTGNDIYYEVALPGHFPTYHQIAAGVANGTPAKLTVLEMHGRPNWWRVWLDHTPVSRPILLPDSHHRWTTFAQIESWDGGTGAACNTFDYSFSRVSIANAPGGDWQQVAGSYPGRSAITS